MRPFVLHRTSIRVEETPQQAAQMRIFLVTITAVITARLSRSSRLPSTPRATLYNDRTVAPYPQPADRVHPLHQLH
jgi:hypothetical protein